MELLRVKFNTYYNRSKSSVFLMEKMQLTAKKIIINMRKDEAKKSASPNAAFVSKPKSFRGIYIFFMFSVSFHYLILVSISSFIITTVSSSSSKISEKHFV